MEWFTGVNPNPRPLMEACKPEGYVVVNPALPSYKFGVFGIMLTKVTASNIF